MCYVAVRVWGGCEGVRWLWGCEVAVRVWGGCDGVLGGCEGVRWLWWCVRWLWGCEVAVRVWGGCEGVLCGCGGLCRETSGGRSQMSPGRRWLAAWKSPKLFVPLTLSATSVTCPYIRSEGETRLHLRPTYGSEGETQPRLRPTYGSEGETQPRLRPTCGSGGGGGGGGNPASLKTNVWVSVKDKQLPIIHNMYQCKSCDFFAWMLWFGGCRSTACGRGCSLESCAVGW